MAGASRDDSGRFQTRNLQVTASAVAHQLDPRRLLADIGRAFARAAEYRRLFILLPFDLILGLIVYAVLPEEPPGWLLGGGLGLLMVASGIAFAFRSVLALRLSTHGLAVWIGLCLLPLHAWLAPTTMLTRPAYGAYVARVDEIISSDATAQRVLVSQISAVTPGRDVLTGRVRLLLPAEPRLAPGDSIRVALRLAPIPGPILPGGYDGQFHSYFAGVGAYGSATGAVELLAPGEPSDLGRQVEEIRRRIGDRIAVLLDEPAESIGKAVVVGDQSGISDETREVMAASGLAHVYSISGLHLSIVAGGVYFLVRLLVASIPALVAWPAKSIGSVFGLLAGFGYLLLAGGTGNVPAFRSTLMLALVFGAVLAGRRALTMRNVAIAALVIIVIDPASVFRPSFQLSFAAVVGLIGVYELASPAGRQDESWLARTRGVLVATAWTSLVAGFATLLFSAYHFQQTAPLGVVGNLLALPFVTFVIMPGALLGVLAIPLGIDAPFFLFMGWGIDRMVDVAWLVAGWSEGLSGNPLLAEWTLFAGLLALAWFAFLDSRWRLAGPVVALAGVGLLGFEPRPDVLIADTTQAVAVATEDGLALVTGQRGSFVVGAWEEHYQLALAEVHPNALCDSIGCIVTLPHYSVAVIRNAAAFSEDCAGHDLVVSRVPVPSGCGEDGVVIGPPELMRGGVQWLRWDGAAGRFDIRPAIVRPNRPWRAVPR